MKKVFIASTAIGCINHGLENSLFKQYFQANSWQVTNSPRKANLIIINSCGLTEESEDLSVNTILRMKKLSAKWQKIVVYGCLTRMNWKRFRSVFKGDYFDFLEKDKIDKIINAKVKINSVSCNVVDSQFNQFILQSKNGGYAFRRTLSLWLYKIENQLIMNYLPLPSFFTASCSYLRRTNMYTIILSSGCKNKCSYCIIRNARGKLKSKPVETALDEFRRGLKLGFKKFELIGDDIGCYGEDAGENLDTLLKKVIKEKGEYRINLYHFYPKHFNALYKGLNKILTSGKISSISVTIQSGSRRILKLMNRDYDLPLLKHNLRELKKIAPSLKINTHLMVGFPGETDKEFMDTLNLLNEIDFSQVAVFKYSDRPCAISHNMGGKVANRIIENRIKKMKNEMLKINIKRIVKKI